MTARRPLVQVAGSIQELSASDTLAGGTAKVASGGGGYLSPLGFSYSGGAPPTSLRALFVYLGLVTEPITVNYISVSYDGGATGAAIVEYGIFSGALPTTTTGMVLTKLASGAPASLTSAPGVQGRRNASAFAQVVPAGTHLYAGVYADANSATLPTYNWMTGDGGRCFALYVNSATAFSAGTTWTTGRLFYDISSHGNQIPLLWAEYA